MMRVHPSGYYAWLACAQSRRRRDDEVLLGHIKHAWLESGGVYGYRKVHTDLQELGIDCGKHRVYRLMRAEGLRSQSGYRRRPSPRGGRPSVVAPNRLQQQFRAAEPNQVWVTDITYIRTYEGWLYLAVVLDLFSRQVIGWSRDAGGGTRRGRGSAERARGRARRQSAERRGQRRGTRHAGQRRGPDRRPATAAAPPRRTTRLTEAAGRRGPSPAAEAAGALTSPRRWRAAPLVRLRVWRGGRCSRGSIGNSFSLRC